MATKEKKEPVKVKKSELITLIKSGMKRKDIADKYGLSMNQIKKLVDLAGLKKSRAAHVEFALENDVDQPEVAPPTEATKTDF